MRSQLDDVVWRSSPENQTVSRICKTGLQSGCLEPEQEGVNEDLVELGRSEFLPLLSISCHPVR